MSQNRNPLKETFIIGFAMFAMFFGAGNLIFPPALGLMSGNQWLPSFLGFFIMDAGLATLGVFAMINYNGDINRVGEQLGHKLSIILAVIVILCIGPCVAIPRTGTVTFSMGFAPLLGIDPDNSLALFIFSIIFFVIVLVLSIKPTKVVDIIGEYLTPILLVCLLIMIVIGFIFAKYTPSTPLAEIPLKEGVTNGYQTMDAMASLLFAGILIKVVAVDTHTSYVGTGKMIAKASIISCSLLFIVYGGLTFLGASWGQSMTAQFLSEEIDQADLLVGIVSQVLGEFGVIAIAIITLFACLTTAVGLTSAIAEYFEELVHHKIDYKVFAVAICVMGALLCNVGLTEILTIASPVLNLIYPEIVVLIVLGVVRRYLHCRLTYIMGTATAFFVAALNVLCDDLHMEWASFIHQLPLDLFGLNYVIPAGITIGVSLIISGIFYRRPENLNQNPQ